MRVLAWWAMLALAGCQVLSGIASYDVGGVAGGGGDGGTGADFGPLCEKYCDLAQTPLLQCGMRACIQDVCRGSLLLDLYPECRAEAFEYGTCLMKRPASDFMCADNGPVPNEGVCDAERGRWMDCLVGTEFDTNQQDCAEACEGPLNGVCGAMPAPCTTACVNSSQPGNDCAGLYAGVAHCAADNQTDAWTCYDLIFAQVAGPSSTDHACYFAYQELVWCLADLQQD